MENPEKEKISLGGLKEMTKNSFLLTQIAWRDRKALVILLLAVSVVSSLFPISDSLVKGGLINELVYSAQTRLFSDNLLFFIVLILGVILLRSLFGFFDSYLDKLFYLYLEEKTQFMILEKFSQLDIDSFDSPEQQDLIQKVNETGTWRVQNFVNNQFYLLRRIIELLSAVLALSFAEWWIFIIVIIGVIPNLVIELRYGRRAWSIHDARAEVKRKFWHLRGKFGDVNTITELKIFQNISHFLKLIKDLFSSFQNDQYRVEKNHLREGVLASFFGQIAYGFIYVYLIRQVVFQGMGIGTFTFFVGAVSTLQGALFGLFWVIGRSYQDSLFVADFFKFLSIKQTVEKPQKGIVLKAVKAPKIVFDNVSFSYPDSGKSVLKNINLEIASGEKIAFVGINGAGKTTLIKLLCRFYDPTEGRILIDGKDLKKIDIESYYSLIGALFQDYSNYRFLVKDAIGVGRTSADFSFDKTVKSAKRSESDVFIEAWGSKYDQQLGKNFTNGVEPSIGQWQKLALARAFYRDPKIYILDEPTSSIDAQAEAKIFEKLEKLSKDKTVILISHRFSTVRKANRIIVIENGEITENGSHEELLKKNKTYARLFKLQAKGYQ